MSWGLRHVTKPNILGFGDTYTSAALRGAGCNCGGGSYTDAALRGAGESYTDAALRGAGESYTDAALRGGDSVQDRIRALFKAKQAMDLKKKSRVGGRKCGGKKIRGKKIKGGFILSGLMSLPAAIKGAKFIINGIKSLLGKASGGGKITPKQKKIYVKLIQLGKK